MLELCSEAKLRHNCGQMSNEFSWLQQWYSAHCDGEWEHGSGITIQTIDNPVWSVRISVRGTELAGVTFSPVKTERSERDWFQCRVAEGEQRFEGFGGPSNLSEIFGVFRQWADKH